VPLFLKLRDGYLNLDLVSNTVLNPEGCTVTFRSGDHCFIEGSGTEHLDKLVQSRPGVTLRSAEPDDPEDESIDSMQFIQKVSEHECLVGYQNHNVVAVTEDVPALLGELNGASTVDPNRLYLTWSLRAPESANDPAA
jgi:hypothetical protein